MCPIILTSCALLEDSWRFWSKVSGWFWSVLSGFLSFLYSLKCFQNREVKIPGGMYPGTRNALWPEKGQGRAQLNILTMFIFLKKKRCLNTRSLFICCRQSLLPPTSVKTLSLCLNTQRWMMMHRRQNQTWVVLICFDSCLKQKICSHTGRHEIST